MQKLLLTFFYFTCSLLFAQQTDYVDFIRAKAHIHFGDLKQNEVLGTVNYQFKILKDIDSIYLDAQNFNKVSYSLNDAAVDSLYDGKYIVVKEKFKANTKHHIKVTWQTSPKKAMYFIDWEYDSKSFDSNVIRKQIWTQGQGKYTSNWFPSIDDMNDKIEFDLSVEFDKNYEVIANGKLLSKEVVGDHIIWNYDMVQPMSSYLLALVIGAFDKKVELSNSGIPLEMYYNPKDSLKVEPTYRYSKQIFDFLESEIGIPFPWQNYKQVPVKDFLYAGMENTGTTVFSDAFVVDSIGYNDKNYINVNAHELAHQWFGDLVTETSGTHHWLQEGFATYYALLAERALFGENYYYWRLYEYANELLDQDRAGAGTSLLDPKSSSTTFYKKGAWVLHMLREQVGDVAFRAAVKSYLNTYQFKNVETNNFISELEKVGGVNLKSFVDNWLKEPDFKYDKAIESLKKSAFIQEYLMVDCEAYNSKCKNYLDSGISDEAKIKVISQTKETFKNNDFKNSLKVRQALANRITTIPMALKKTYESLLDDNSYVTIETVLYNLWNNFPADRFYYLDKTKNIDGFSDKNIRILWLVLALNTEGYDVINTSRYFNELVGYTSAIYSAEIRRNAFQYLTWMNSCNDACLKNLVEATKHHSWQFSKFAKQLLESKQNTK
ncbi:M1 family metallopeptidase [Gaetbulibacter saemankumensis]|uniref:M1 family metallopeptidase n=1 Tax=Gaetbulibacter saemankumensis TaxID=311208 RepID=UPI0004132FE7|nr:M1 family metallopeptidase [Gaetbulibacter saemankumensis]